MFDPKLTLSTGFERLGEVLDGRQSILPPDHPLIAELKRIRAIRQRLYDEHAIYTHQTSWGPFDSLSSRATEEHKDLFDLLKPSDDLDATLHPFQSERYSMRTKSLGSCFFEAVSNAFLHGSSNGIVLTTFIGRNGQLSVIYQEDPGPDMNQALGKSQGGLSSQYSSGKYARGFGMDKFATEEHEFVWHADLGSGYAALIFAPSTKPVEERPPAPEPSTPEWRPKAGTLDEKLWKALLNCEAGTGDPRVYYAHFFVEDGLTLKQALAKMHPQVVQDFNDNLDGFLHPENYE